LYSGAKNRRGRGIGLPSRGQSPSSWVSTKPGQLHSVRSTTPGIAPMSWPRCSSRTRVRGDTENPPRAHPSLAVLLCGSGPWHADKAREPCSSPASWATICSPRQSTLTITRASTPAQDRTSMFVRRFSTTSRPACGRPPAAAVLGRQHPRSPMARD
jgi:hypothetical protein